MSLGLDNIKGDVRHTIDLTPNTINMLLIAAGVYLAGQVLGIFGGRK